MNSDFRQPLTVVCLSLLLTFQTKNCSLFVHFSNQPISCCQRIFATCGTKNIDRDVNAAKNIRDEGLRIFSSGTGDKAYRQTVRHSNRGRKKSTTEAGSWVGSLHCNQRLQCR
jgi:transposase